MKTFEQLQKEWGESTCGRSIEEYIFDQLQKQNSEYIEALDELLEALYDSRAQIEYLHNKFQKTGTSESVLRKLENVITKYENRFA